MPQYKNTTSTVITIGALRLEPGETKSTDTFIKVLPTGVTKQADTPYYDPIIQSNKVTATSTITVPSTLTGNYKIKIYVTAGEVSIQYNNSTAESLLLGVGMTEERLCLNRTIDNVIFTISSGTAYISIEKA